MDLFLKCYIVPRNDSLLGKYVCRYAESFIKFTSIETILINWKNSSSGAYIQDVHVELVMTTRHACTFPDAHTNMEERIN